MSQFQRSEFPPGATKGRDTFPLTRFHDYTITPVVVVHLTHMVGVN